LFKKIFLVSLMLVLFHGIGKVNSSRIYDLPGNVKEVQMSQGEEQELKDIANQFLIRVKNRQYQVIADTMLYFPEKTFEHRNLTNAEIKAIKDSFIKGLKEDASDWSSAILVEVRKFRMTGPSYAMSKDSTDSLTIHMKVKNKKEFVDIGNNKRFPPLMIHPVKCSSGYKIANCNNLTFYEKDGCVKVIPAYPPSVNPM